MVCTQRQTQEGGGVVLSVPRPVPPAPIEAEVQQERVVAGEGDSGAPLWPATGRPRVRAGEGTAERRGNSRVDKHFLRRTVTGRPEPESGGRDADKLDARHARPLEDKAARAPLASGTGGPRLRHQRSGTSRQLETIPLEQRNSVTVRVREGQRWHAVDIAETDWLVLQHSRFGASPDLVVSLRLREALGRSDLERLTPLDADVVPLDRHSWPTSWEDFVSSVENGIHFRVEPCERGGMDPARQAELADLRFPDDLDWPLLDQGYQMVRRQEALPEAYPPVYRKRAELLAEATQLYQWERMASVPAGNNHGECSPARMAALLVLLARKQGGRVRTPPPGSTRAPGDKSLNYGSIASHRRPTCPRGAGLQSSSRTGS